jgi:pyruvate/2-oxoglutarate dehydrogenase complex dihydrolipoamide dehydrogenase (E3) component
VRPLDLLVNADTSLLVAGGGPAGITAALRARELGARVTLLEAGQVGGTSLNRGPAPARTLARAARLARDWSSWSSFGLQGPAPVPDLPAVLANSERVARYAHDKKDVAGHPRRQGIDLIEDLGPVRFTGPHSTAATDGRAWSADQAEDGITSQYRNGAGHGRMVAGAVFFAAGWPANLSQLNLDAAGVRAEPGTILVDDYLRTDVEHIYAAGDVNGNFMLVQTARTEGRIAARSVSMAAQKICRTLGIGRFPQVWSYLGSEE